MGFGKIVFMLLMFKLAALEVADNQNKKE